MAGRLTRRSLSVWAENVQGEIQRWGWKEEVMGERTALSDHQRGRGVSERIPCSKCKVGVISRHQEGRSTFWVASTGVCGGHYSCPQWCGQRHQDKIDQASHWGFNRGEIMYPVISLSRHYHPLLKTLGRLPVARRTEAGLFCCPQSW